MSETGYEVVFTFLNKDDAERWLERNADCGLPVQDCRCPIHGEIRKVDLDD